MLLVACVVCLITAWELLLRLPVVTVSWEKIASVSVTIQAGRQSNAFDCVADVMRKSSPSIRENTIIKPDNV